MGFQDNRKFLRHLREYNFARKALQSEAELALARDGAPSALVPRLIPVIAGFVYIKISGLL